MSSNDSQLKSLSDLFKDKMFRIPDYQRGYSWEKKQIDEFIDDLKIMDINNDDIHYTGMLSLKEFGDKEKENLKEKPQGAVLKFGEQLYLMPEGFPALKGLKVLRPGLHLGTLKKNRFEPSHALALAMQPQEAFHVAMLSSGSQEIRQYLMGQTFSWGGEKGWYLICVDGYSIGWGKLAGGIMKNHYPKGLRMVDII